MAEDESGLLYQRGKRTGDTRLPVWTEYVPCDITLGRHTASPIFTRRLLCMHEFGVPESKSGEAALRRSGLPYRRGTSRRQQVKFQEASEIIAIETDSLLQNLDSTQGREVFHTRSSIQSEWVVRYVFVAG